MNDPEIVVRTDDENASMDVEVIDGCLMNMYGEVIGIADFDALDEVVDEATADEILGRIAEVQARLVAHRLRRDAILANLAAIEHGHQARLDYLTMRFAPLLEAYAARRLKFAKKRSFDLPNGRIGFRKHAGTCRITDMERAVAFVKSIDRADLVEAKTTEKVSPHAVLEFVEWFEEHKEAAPSDLDFLERTPPGDRAYFRTGILDG